MTVDELATLIRDEIATAMQEPDQVVRMANLRAAGDTIFRLAYEEVPGDPRSIDQAAIDFTNVLNGAVAMTYPDGTDEQVDRVTRVWSLAAANAAVYYAADPRSSKTWITMDDDRVREQHVPMHGTTVGAGQRFIVAGVPMRYPGEPVGPPELWINCRCHLRTGPEQLASAGVAPAASALVADQFATSDALVARSFDTATRKAMAKRHTAMPDGSFPIANAEDLHNAIQAIGRAKDPDKVKAHIRRRAKALGLSAQLPESWSASAEPDGELREASGSNPTELLAVNTHDAPGWLTHPKETQRLRTYWTRGAGAAKIGWGSPGDLTRCAKYLSKYVAPNHVWGTCQNMHHAALGHFNPESRGRHGGGDPDEIIDAIDAAFLAAAQLEDDMEILAPPAEWFQQPDFDAPTPLTITSDGRVLGHLASWDTCHVGITGECVKPPRSNTNYAHFRTGEIETREGELVAVGQITMDTGHADKSDAPMAAVSHYDDTGTGVADVNAGEDAHGIWIAGAMRPGVSEHQLYVLKATGALSGDWRRIGGNLELVAALAVNVPGFPIPRVEMAASGAGPVYSLVAAAVVTVDPNAERVDRIAIAVADELAARASRSARAARVQAASRTLRAEAVMAAAR